MNYTIYNPTTGEIISQMGFSSQDLANLNLQGKTYIEGTYDSMLYSIVDGQAIAKIPVSIWTEDFVRQNRNSLLSAIDRINPVWYASLTQQQQAELVAYRQQLLDVPQQEGFPTTIVWPAQPVWL